MPARSCSCLVLFLALFVIGEAAMAQEQTMKGGEVRYFASPNSYPGQLQYADWVLRIKKV